MRHLTSFASTRWGKLLLAVVLIALVAGLVFQGVGREPASAAPAQVSEMSSFLCTPIAVAAFSNRVHVQCTTAPAYYECKWQITDPTTLPGCGVEQSVNDYTVGSVVEITVTNSAFPITMPLLGTFIGSQSINLSSTIQDVVVRVPEATPTP